MSDPDQLKRQLGDLGLKFLKRTEAELPIARSLVERIGNGSHAAIEDLERLAHRIYGTGATFGFENISEHAGAMERLAAAAKHQPAVSALTVQRLMACMEQLTDAVQANSPDATL